MANAFSLVRKVKVCGHLVTKAGLVSAVQLQHQPTNRKGVTKAFGAKPALPKLGGASEWIANLVSCCIDEHGVTSVSLGGCFCLGAALVSDVFQNYRAVAKSCSWWVTKVEEEGIKKTAWSDGNVFCFFFFYGCVEIDCVRNTVLSGSKYFWTRKSFRLRGIRKGISLL